MLERALVVVRHNTEMAGDFRLALREFESLIGCAGVVLKERKVASAFLEHLPAAHSPHLPTKGEFVAVAWVRPSVDGIERLVRRAAFGQEVFVQGTDAAVAEFVARIGAAAVQIPQTGVASAVALCYNYIIESEGVLGPEPSDGRVRATIELLRQPYVGGGGSAHSRRIRAAKKTTLSLSHDLHIYKAKFFPRMVRALMNVYGTSGSPVVFDPFCGSGTALLEASLLGLPSFGCDIDPISQMIAQAKVAPFLEPEALFKTLSEFSTKLDEAESQKHPGYTLPQELAAKLQRRDRIDGTNYFGEITREAAVVASALKKTRERGRCHDVLKVMVSDAMTKKIRYRFIGVGNGRYTIEIIKQPLLDRLREKIERCRQLAGVFEELSDVLGIKLAPAVSTFGDARDRSTWPAMPCPVLIVTSPPYLPASSGREHYAASRALAFSVLGLAEDQGYHDTATKPARTPMPLKAFPEACALMEYLESDSSEEADPQRDAMRFERKAVPTREYLADMRQFFSECGALATPGHPLLLVVAHHHIFYSHRRQELEHEVSGRALYAELAAPASLVLEEELEMQLLKSQASHARPMAKNDYYETILVLGKKASGSAPEVSHGKQRKPALAR